MADKSGIHWTDATWNPTTGCTKVSPGCKYCYAKHKVWPRLSKNPATVYYGRKFEDVQVHPERLNQPLQWKRPRMIFVNSMSDLFHESLPYVFIYKVFETMARCPQHIFQILTKRPARMLDFLTNVKTLQLAIDSSQLWERHPLPLPNVWLGVSVENQETADERIPLLLETPAAIRWLSCEPLLGPLDLRKHGDLDRVQCGIDWIVVGGESGSRARPMREQWALSIRRQCKVAGVPFFMKQGSQANWPHYHDFNSFPPSLQVREYPIERGEKK